tara:strand:+ start:28 stop:303 length:276 start_codon:yes stop_codon:yes gene_type:complete
MGQAKSSPSRKNDRIVVEAPGLTSNVQKVVDRLAGQALETEPEDIIGTPDLLDEQFSSSYNPDMLSKQPRSRYLQGAGNNLASSGNMYSRF